MNNTVIEYSRFCNSYGRLDVGEGKDVSLEDHCPRSKLHKQCIKYLGPVSLTVPLLIQSKRKTIQAESARLQMLHPINKICCHGIVQKERESYEVIVEDKRLMYKLSRQIVDTTGSATGTKWIFVLSTCKTLYIGQASNNSPRSSNRISLNVDSISETDARPNF